MKSQIMIFGYLNVCPAFSNPCLGSRKLSIGLKLLHILINCIIMELFPPLQVVELCRVERAGRTVRGGRAVELALAVRLHRVYAARGQDRAAAGVETANQSV